MSFHVGQKIVCIRDDWFHPLVHLVESLPRKGAIYHVRGYDPESRPEYPYIWLQEISNPIVFYHREPAFAEEYFRPVIEKKTDISIFTKMLAPPMRERIDA